MHRLKHVLLTLTLSVVAILSLLMTLEGRPLFAQTESPHKGDAIIGDHLASEMAAHAQDQDYIYRFIIRMNDQVEFDFSRMAKDADTRRADIVRSLEDHARESQKMVLDDISDLSGRSQVTRYRSFWIFNGISAEGTADAIYTLSKHPHIASIQLDRQIEPVRPMDDLTHDTTEIFTQTWGTHFIRAPQVWHGLGITGTGVTVAIMDTGVDFTHPILSQNYRGLQPNGSFQHEGNWFHAGIPTATVPTDLDGHGTHVAGTAVGSNGIGVAPGAEWIAVGVSDLDGLWFESSINTAFEWLLAPGGDPSLAPDIVNGSWGGFSKEPLFLPEVELLKQAGIIPVFAAGNSGPYTETLGLPSSFTNTLSIASISPDGATSWFSSRGPSTFHNNPSPIIAAPGGYVYSSLPGNKFAYLSGTSMATPHVSGALALLLSASPATKDNRTIMSLLAESAVPYENNHPNYSSGYGALDAAELVEDFAKNSSSLSGILQSGGVPLPNQPISITTQTGTFELLTDSNGQYFAKLVPGRYSIQVSHLNYEAYDSGSITVGSSRTIFNVSLNRKPMGTFYGRITYGGSAISNTRIIIQPGNIEIKSQPDGGFEIDLPVDSYQISVVKSGFEVEQATIEINQGVGVSQNFDLEETNSILLIDSGAWNYRSRESYYQNALIELGKGWDTFTINDPVLGTPSYGAFDNYDVVIWSDPNYSPGYIDAAGVISDYASSGGNILLTGQNIAQLDYLSPFSNYYLSQIAFARPVLQTSDLKMLSGSDETSFAGFRALLNGYESADDQTHVTLMKPFYPAKSELIMNHGSSDKDDLGVGIRSGHCEQYNLVYLSFGISGVQGTDKQAQILRNSLEWFNRPIVETGVQWLNPDVDIPVVPGESYGYEALIYNRSETMTRTFSISSVSEWATSVLTPNLTIGPCELVQTTVTVTVPSGLDNNIKNQTKFFVTDTEDNSAVDYFIVDHKTPATLLLVEDYRWYDQIEIYKPVLDELGIDYDIWTHEHLDKASPSTQLLKQYDYLVWFTAYDWFEPLTEKEVSSLEQYLADGGRLFLNSQDFNYYHSDSDLFNHYFGLAGFSESITPTVAFSHQLLNVNQVNDKNLSITFDQYKNHGDLLLLDPSSSAIPLLWHDRGIGGIGNAGSTPNENWRAVFWGIPFETLELGSHQQVMANTLGWLTDLGESQITAESEFMLPGQTQPFTITIRNRPNGVTQTVSISNPLPAGLSVIDGSLSTGAIWSEADQTIYWSGELTPGAAKNITYQATAQTSGQILNQVFIDSNTEQFTFQRGTFTQVGGANYSQSQSSAEFSPPFTNGRQITVTVTLINNGNIAGNNITATTYIPEEFNYLTNTLTTLSGSAVYSRSRIIWTGDLEPSQTVTVTAVYTSPYYYLDDWVQSNLTVADNGKTRWINHDSQFFASIKNWLPVLKQSK